MLQQQLNNLDVAFETGDVEWQRAGKSIDVSVRPCENPFDELDVIQADALLEEIVAEVIVNGENVLMLSFWENKLEIKY